MTPFAIAGIQMPIAADRENLTAMGHRLELLMRRFPWVQMVLFSELAPFGPLPNNAQPLPGPAEETLCRMASHHGIWLIPGSLFERDGERIYNTAPVIDPDGRVVTRYRKMFPFQPYETGISSGDRFTVFDVPGAGRFGLSICYDMWFPETTRTLASMGAEVILHPTLTDTMDRDVELSIARASAVTNQCYFFDINGVGDGGIGRSIIVGPSGYVIHESRGGAEVMPVEIDLDRVRREREVGIRGLGQPLKSFRDRPVDFQVYQRGSQEEAYLHSLGPLAKPARGSRAGLSGPFPPVPLAGDAGVGEPPPAAYQGDQLPAEEEFYGWTTTPYTDTHNH
ncbi:MAG: carbon-nitrogen hydrolase family protein [Candidatus Competibacteraceae bacterium]|nr:carbon-nitrogen hydrolase family protein [Candidatus Competibacteraceae bacterium]